jgi:hypothetical protein
VTGISTVSGAIAGSEQLPTIIAPARPDSSTGGAEADRDTGGTNPDTDPRAQEQPPR